MQVCLIQWHLLLAILSSYCQTVLSLIYRAHRWQLCRIHLWRMTQSYHRHLLSVQEVEAKKQRSNLMKNTSRMSFKGSRVLLHMSKLQLHSNLSRSLFIIDMISYNLPLTLPQNNSSSKLKSFWSFYRARSKFILSSILRVTPFALTYLRWFAICSTSIIKEFI